MPDTKAAKTALRDRLVAARRALSAADLAAAAEALADHLLAEPAVRAAVTLTAYVGVGDEPGTGLLLDRLHDAGRRVLLPLVVRATDGPGLDLDWAEYAGPGSLARARYGLLEPTTAPLGVDAVARAEVLLVPGMAAGPTGMRMGKGAGCYDRALARARGTSYLLLHDGETGLDVPAEPHDRPVDAAVTPSGIVRFGGLTPRV